jgi:hypothetical protein
MKLSPASLLPREALLLSVLVGGWLKDNRYGALAQTMNRYVYTHSCFISVAKITL